MPGFTKLYPLPGMHRLRQAWYEQHNVLHIVPSYTYTVVVPICRNWSTFEVLR